MVGYGGRRIVGRTKQHACRCWSNGSTATGNWILSAWATPGEVNLVWPAYTGSTDLAITEVLPYCNDDSIEPTEDWVEVHNQGTTPLNISRWSIMTADGDRRFIRLNSLWAGENETPSVLLQPDERAVFTMEEYVLTGLGDALTCSIQTAIPSPPQHGSSSPTVRR